MGDGLDAVLRTTYLTVYNPLGQGLTFLGLELTILVCSALTLAHALRAYRQGDGSRLFTWTSVVAYGLMMEFASYEFLDNFTHGQFTVMFYHQKLPLYVIAIYPVLIYAPIQLAERLRLPRWAEPFTAGLAIVAMDVPFDVLGPDAGWWSWSATDPNVAYRWHGVPVNSYYWHFAFGGVLALLTRAARGYVGGLGRTTDGRRVPGLWKLALALPVAGLTPALGRIAFLPYDILKLLHVQFSEGTVVAALFATGLAITVLAKKEVVRTKDPVLLAVPCLFYGYHTFLTAVFYGGGRYAEPGSKAGMILAFTLLALVLNVYAHRMKGALAAPAGESA